jgi:hypothetical protein
LHACLALGIGLAIAGCKAATPAAPVTPAKPGGGGDATAPARPPISNVVVPDGFPLSVSPARIQEVSGDLSVTGSLVGSGSVPINDALVYFTSPKEEYYVARTAESDSSGFLVAVRTDHAGNFATPGVFPRDRSVVANALLARNRRLVGFGVTGSDSPVRITLGSTYAFEFFRDTVFARGLDQAGQLGRAEVRGVLVSEGQRGDAIMAAEPPASGSAAADPDADLTVGNGAVLAARYAVRALANNAQTFKAWKAVFPNLYALTTLAGTFNLRDNEPTEPMNAVSLGLNGPAGVTQGPRGDDAVYIAERNGWHIKRVDAGGNLTVVAGRLGGQDPSVIGATISADATALSSPIVFFKAVHAIAADSLGNLAATFKDEQIVGFVSRVGGTYYGRQMAQDTLYYLNTPDNKPGWIDGAPSGGTPTARFRDPNGVTFDDKDHIYVCDRRNNVIRRIDRSTGNVETVLGDGWPFIERIRSGPGFLGNPFKLTKAEVGLAGTDEVEVVDFGRMVDQDKGTGSGLKASFNRPLHLAWRKAGNNQELYIYDSYNNVVRRAVTGYSESFKDAEVKVFAGQTQAFTSESRVYAVTVGKTGGLSDGKRADVTVNVASYTPDDRGKAQVVTGGLALDKEHGRLYVSDTNNRAVRTIFLDQEDKVVTIAKHDPNQLEGDAGRVVLSQSLAGMTVLRGGDLVVCDQANHVVRRIHIRHDF